MKKKDLTGQKFGRLTALNQVQSRISRSGKKIIQWLCQCDCGNSKIVSTTDLQSGHVRSCGCLRSEKSKNVRLKAKKYFNNNFVENTSISQLQATFKNNTSGKKGVCWDKNKHIWKAYINFQRKRINLGSFDNIDDAIKAREDAEEQYFQPILDKYKKD